MMRLKLVSLPDTEVFKPSGGVKVGEMYVIIGSVGNGYSVWSDKLDKDGNPVDTLIILKERFQ